MADIARLLVTFSGVDGSGKSTLAEALIEKLDREHIKTDYVWWFTANDSFFGRIMGAAIERYAKPVERNAGGFPKVGRLRTLYQSVVLIDFLLHVWSSFILGKNLVCDRYVYDIVVFFTTELHYPISRAKKLIRVLRRLTPKPKIAFLVDVPSSIAMQRKHDIPSAAEHEKLRDLYFDLAKGDPTVKLVDGSQALEEAKSVVWSFMRDYLKTKRPRSATKQ